ncbi:hypothetical protein GCM10009630_24600 [Kribbella jejuensis]
MHQLPRQRVPDEHHLPLVPGDAVSPVRDWTYLQLNYRPDQTV